MTDFFNLIIFPWNSLNLAGIFLYVSVGQFYIVWMFILIFSYSKKIRELSYSYYFTYIFLFSCNILFLFILLWYAALPLMIVVSFFTYRSAQKVLKKVRNEEQEGGWCCNFKYRKQQIEDFKFKTEQEQQEYRDYCTSHPKELKPLPLIAFSVILPIAITLCLWLSGVGYRWYGYPLVQIDLNAIK